MDLEHTVKQDIRFRQPDSQRVRPGYDNLSAFRFEIIGEHISVCLKIPQICYLIYEKVTEAILHKVFHGPPKLQDLAASVAEDVSGFLPGLQRQLPDALVHQHRFPGSAQSIERTDFSGIFWPVFQEETHQFREAVPFFIKYNRFQLVSSENIYLVIFRHPAHLLCFRCHLWHLPIYLRRLDDIS